MPDCDEGQLDGVNGPLHLLLPVEEHKDDHIYKMLTMHPCSNKMREALGNPSLTPEEFLPIPGIKKSRVDLLFLCVKILILRKYPVWMGWIFHSFISIREVLILTLSTFIPLKSSRPKGPQARSRAPKELISYPSR